MAITKKKLLSLVMALVMVVSLFPVSAFATETETGNNGANGENGAAVAAETVYTTEPDTTIVGSATVALVGSGTQEDPYLIASVADLIAFRDDVNSKDSKYNAPGVYVALVNDIDLSGIDWSVNIGDDCNYTFDGIFDGKGHTICNLTSSETAQKVDGYICTGLFGAIGGSAVIQNLTLKNVNINTGDFTGNNAGALVGFAYYATGSIENVTVSNVEINGNTVDGTGAIVGYAYGGSLTINDCRVIDSTINGQAFVGGIIGYAGGKTVVRNCTVTNTDVNASSCCAGGIAGILQAGSTISGGSVNNVALSSTHENWQNSVAIAVGCVDGTVTVSNVAYSNVNTSYMVGSVYAEKPTAPVPHVQARVGDKYYLTLAGAVGAAQPGDTVTVLADINVDTDGVKIDKNLTLDLNGKEIHSQGDALVVTAGTLTINGSGLVSGGESGIGSWCAVWANGGHVIINGGTYACGGDNRESTPKHHQNDMIYTKNGGTVVVNGGEFLYTEGVWTLNENDENHGTITVCGGVFHGWNPADNASEGTGTNFVADGYEVKESNGVYIVSEKLPVAQVGEQKYKTLKEAIDAAQAGDTVVIYAGTYNGDVSINKAITVVGAGDGDDVIINGKVSISGNGVTLKNVYIYAPDANGDFCALLVNGGNILVENCTIVGGNGMRWCYANNGDVILRGCTVVGDVYGVHFDGGNGEGDVIIEGGSITGWTSFGAAVEHVSISGTRFEEGEKYNYVRSYTNTTFTKVSFNSKMTVDVTLNTNLFNGCTVDNGTIEDLLKDQKITASVTTAEGTVFHKTLKDAIDAVKTVPGNHTITLLPGVISENVTIPQNEGVNITIVGDGENTIFTGKIEIHGNSRFDGAETLTIRGIHFKLAEAGDIIASAHTKDHEKNGIKEGTVRYAHNVTIEDCYFETTASGTVVAIRITQGYDITVKNCTAVGLHSLMQTKCEGITIEGVTVLNCKNGISLNNSQNVIVKDSTFAVNTIEGYGLRADACDGSVLTIEDCTIKAFIPVLVRPYEKTPNANYSYNLVINGKNTFTGTNEYGYWGALSDTDYDGKVDLAKPTFQYTVKNNDSGLKLCDMLYPYTHSAAEAVIENKIDATCTADGSFNVVVYCDRCGDKLSREHKTIDKLGHDAEEHAAKAPTCTEIGWDAYVTCTRCDYTTYVEKAALGHADANKDNICDVCETILCQDGNHKEETIPAKAPTCTETGLTEGKKCSACGEILVEQTVVDAKGHDHESVVTAPTCTEPGYTTHTCACGDSYVDSETAATGHSYGAWYVVMPATRNENGLERRDCANCDHFEARYTDKLTSAAPVIPETPSYDYPVVPNVPNVPNVNIPDEDVPMGGGDDLTDIEDEDTPLGSGEIVTVETEVTTEEIAEAVENGTPVVLNIEAVATSEEKELAPQITITTNSDEDVRVEIPVENVTSGTVVILVNEDGTETILTTSSVTENGVVADLPDGATVKIVDNAKTFDDVKTDDWFSNAVAFVSARGILTGVEEGEFGNKALTSRAMVWTLLARISGVDTTKGENWYSEAQAWVIENGIADGQDPTKDITREELVTMMWICVGKPEGNGDLSIFGDVDQITAKDASSWAVENAVMNGMDGNMNPEGIVTRAQLAQFVMNYISNAI